MNISINICIYLPGGSTEAVRAYSTFSSKVTRHPSWFPVSKETYLNDVSKCTMSCKPCKNVRAFPGVAECTYY